MQIGRKYSFAQKKADNRITYPFKCRYFKLIFCLEIISFYAKIARGSNCFKEAEGGGGEATNNT